MLLWLIYVPLSQSSETSFHNIEDNIATVNRLYESIEKQVDRKKLLEISNQIIDEREHYASNIVAKVYILLADSAEQQGDLATSFQFAADGLTLLDIDANLELKFLEKLALGYYSDGKHTLALETLSKSIDLAKEVNNVGCLLISLSSRAMTNALLNNNESALQDLSSIKLLIDQQPQYATNTKLREIIALAHSQLGQNAVAIEIYTRLISLKIESDVDDYIDKTYFNLANSYLALKQYDDAHNAFWHARESAKKVDSPIRLAYAQMGFGLISMLQGELDIAYKELKLAEQVFSGQNQSVPYLSTLTYLAQTSKKLNRKEDSNDYLKRAELIASEIEVRGKQVVLFKLLSEMYEEQNEIKKSLDYLQQYLQLTLVDKDESLTKENESSEGRMFSTKQNLNLAHKIVDEGDLRQAFAKKYEYQRNVIVLLSIVIAFLTVLIVILQLRKRAMQHTRHYNENEKPEYFLYSPAQTKNLYQLQYKKARTYEYDLAIGYFIVSNWEPFSFQFNQKIKDEVCRTIATLINKSLGKFDYAGVLNDGQYLILCPHQTKEEIQGKLESIKELIGANLFANLGDFTIETDFVSDSPNIEDIDPYIFLSKLSESMSTKYAL